MWVTRDDAVLLVRHENEDAWSDPGGKRERGETFAEAARRETREEAGVEVTIDGVAEVRWFTERPEPLRYDALADFPMPTDNG